MEEALDLSFDRLLVMMMMMDEGGLLVTCDISFSEERLIIIYFYKPYFRCRIAG